MVIHFRLRHKRHITKVKELGIVVLIMSIAAALIDTIWALYINSFVGKAALVGLISAFFTGTAIFLYFYFIPFMERHEPNKIYIFSLVIYAVTYILFAINRNFYFLIILGFILTVGAVLRKESMGVMIRNESKLKEIGKNESLVYTLSNVGWLIGPLIAGFLADKYGINIVFALAAVFVLMTIIIFRLAGIHEKVQDCKIDGDVWKNFKDFFGNRELVKNYLIAMGVDIWWVPIYIFVPLYIVEQGLGYSWIGIFLFAVVIPLVLLEYSVGKKADQHGFKLFFIAGYSILAVLSFIVFFIRDIYWLMGLLVIASIGAALLEPTTEAYFFKLVPKTKEYKYYGPFCTAVNTGGVISKLLLAGILFILPFRYIFLGTSLMMAFFTAVSLNLKKN